jgi:hypothetical protein
LNAAETAQSVEIDLSAERVSEPHLLFGKSEIQVTGGRIRLTLPARTGAIIME